MAKLNVRIALDPAGKIGPGKIGLLEEIGRCGSISAAGREMAMSYRRAWDLVEDLNGLFATPVVESQIGGKNGGGAKLTALGLTVIDVYRAIEETTTRAARAQLAVLQSHVSKNKTSVEKTGSAAIAPGRIAADGRSKRAGHGAPKDAPAKPVRVSKPSESADRPKTTRTPPSARGAQTGLRSTRPLAK